MVKDSKLIKLHIGCGANHMKGWVNVDCLDMGQEVICNLNAEPWPFTDNSVGEIYANHVLEHIDINVFFSQIKRICAEGCIIRSNTPHCSHISAFCHLQHRNYFGLNSFDEGFLKEFEMQKILTPKKRELVWRKRFYPSIIDRIINKFPEFSERYLAHYLGGIEEMRFVLRVNK